MVELSTQKQLALLFPHSNKALMQTLQQATPEQLATLSEAKDLSSLLKGLITDTLDVRKSNTIILEILKNSEFFKEMGNFSKELKSLTDYLQANEKSLSRPDATGHKQEAPRNISMTQVTQALSHSLEQLGEQPLAELKSQIKNSGLLWESKISQSLQSNSRITALLQELHTQLMQSKLPQANALLEQITSLLQNLASPSQDASALQNPALKHSLNALVEQLMQLNKQVDTLFSRPVENLGQQLKLLLNQSHTPFEQIRQVIEDIRAELRISNESQTPGLIKGANSLMDRLLSMQNSDKTSHQFSVLAERLQQLLPDTKPEHAAALHESIDKFKQISRLPLLERERLLPEIIQFLQHLPQKLPVLSRSEGLLDLIYKILDTLKPPLEGSYASSLKQELQSWMKQLENAMAKADPLLSSQLHKSAETLEHLLKSPAMNTGALLQEEFHKDLKAMLLHLDQELPKMNAPADMLKQVDKLLVQVEYFQLLSHLSHETFVYIPYHWDMLENGHLAIKKAKDNSSYCEIDLELCEYGKLNIMLQLYDDNQLNISIHTEQDKLATLFKENKEQLMNALRSVNIMPRTVKIRQHDAQRALHPYAPTNQLNALGFEAKG